MSRRKAEAGAPAAATRARRRLTASLGPAGGDDSGGPGTAGATGQGLLEHGAPCQGTFTYDGGAQRDLDTPDASVGGRASGPAKFRWRTGIRIAVLLGIVSLLLGGWFWWDVASSRGQVVPLGDVSTPDSRGQPDGSTGTPDPGESGGTSEGGQASGPASGRKIVVHVTGAVNSAGVVALPEGSRIHEAIAAVGGSTATADLERLNLAAVLADGQKVHVPQAGDPAEAQGTAGNETGSDGTGSGGQGTGSAKVDLNTASVEELGTLPRVGPVLAQRIFDWRKEHGRFSAVEELDAVDGVGPKMLETLLPLVRVS
ncbi:helix-hairpin-helix domain-containing protein [Arthrobacter sp. Leaf337]|uniref:helix-hairpin-helix domain-containing protein n=1 Tax=Arthrobacter sp. Leaf337 TaxID=1736342 RepID=UPI0009E7972F|nr:helix-hairpin-helix domain-containing protein [Arthrobacter sp. Leaf337]